MQSDPISMAVMRSVAFVIRPRMQKFSLVAVKLKFIKQHCRLNFSNEQFHFSLSISSGDGNIGIKGHIQVHVICG